MRLGWTTFLLGVAVCVAPGSAQATEETACSAAHVRAQVLKRDAPDKLHERRIALHTCSSALCARSIVEECSTWLQNVDALVPDLTVRVIDTHGVAVANAAIRIDGKAQAAGIPLDLDPGEHAVVAVADTTESRTVVLRSGEKGRSLEIVMGSASPVATPPALADKSTLSTASSRTVAYVLGGAGVVAIGVGVVTGVVALNAANDRNKACGPHFPKCTDATDDSKRREVTNFQDRTMTMGNIATVAFVGGALLVATGIWLYLANPPPIGTGLQPWRTALTGRHEW